MNVRSLLTIIFYIIYFASTLTADQTYFDYDKLVFGNGGGLEVAPTDNGTYILQILNLSGSDTEYTSKAFNVDGKLMSVVPTTGNAYAQNDFMQMTSAGTFTSGIAPVINDTTSFPSDMNFLAGEYLGTFMLFNENTMEGYKYLTGNNYKSAPIYFQKEYGTMYIGSTNEDLPVLSIYPTVNNTPYWGINTTKPVSMVTVSGNFKVDGTLIPDKPFGLFDSVVQTSGLHQFDTESGYVLLTDLEFELEGFASANVMFFGEVGSVDTGVDYGAWVHVRMTLDYYNTVTSTWETYPNPLYSESTTFMTLRRIDGDTRFKGYHLLPFFLTKLDIDPNNDGSPALYKVGLYGNGGGGGQFFPERASIYIAGLPTGNYESVSVSSPVSSVDTAELIERTSFSEIDGNYITDQMISFGSGAAILESGHNLIFSDGTNYIDFKASSVSFGEYHKVDSLKIMNDSTKYPFQIGNTAAQSLGFAPYSSFYTGDLATHNIQTLNAGTAYNDTLQINSDVYFAENSRILTDGIVSPNVQIGNDINSDSSMALQLTGDLLFTGDFTGDLIKIEYLELDPTAYNGIQLSGGAHINDAPNVITITLEEGGNWDLMIWGFLNVDTIDDNRGSNFIEIHITGTSEHYSGRNRMTTDNTDATAYSTLYKIYHLSNFPPGTYNIHLDVAADWFQTTGTRTLKTDPNNDGNHLNGTTDQGEMYGGAIAVIAMPSNS